MFSKNYNFHETQVPRTRIRVVKENRQEDVLATLHDAGFISLHVDDMDYAQFGEFSEFILELISQK
jgi:hypothetical protein